jgi:hypothetical protein
MTSIKWIRLPVIPQSGEQDPSATWELPSSPTGSRNTHVGSLEGTLGIVRRHDVGIHKLGRRARSGRSI